jgi:geranylgeranyl diphosphate synthase type I
MGNTWDYSQKDIEALVKERGQRVHRRFKEEAISGVNDPKLLEVLRFVCDYWKDNFRPALVSLCCEAVGGQGEAADEAGLMMSLTSAGGGIHDDIVDKSCNKHFRMTVLGEYDIDAAVLVGDLLILKGGMLARKLIEKYCQPGKLDEVIDAFGRWTLEVCEAEFMETQCRQNLETELEHYTYILSKSMADVPACARLGAIIGGGSESEIQGLAEFASRLGFMYRLIDDIKDTLNIEFSLLYRLRYESVTLPILYSASQSEQRKVAIKEIFEKLVENDLNLDELLEYCFESKAFEYVFKLGKKNFEDALRSLDTLKPTLAKRTLTQIIKGSFSEISNLSNLR